MWGPKKSALFMTVLAVVLLVSVVAEVYQVDFSGSAQPIKILTVSIEGQEKLYVNTPASFTASVNGSVFGSLTYVWSIEPQDEKILFESNGASCVVTYVAATTEPYLLKVEVYDEGHGFGVASKTIYDPASYPSTYLGIYGASYSYQITPDESGAYYYSINGKTGQVSTPSTTAKTIFDSAWAAMTTGGIINFKGTINLGASGLVFSVSPIKGLILQGDGQKSTQLTHTSGYALTIQPEGSLGYNSFTLRDFSINGSAVTTGRNGICIDRVGRIGVIERVNIDNVDVGILYNGTNVVRTQNVRINVANTAYQTVPAPSPGGDTNELSFVDCDAIWTYNYGYNISGGSGMSWRGGSIAPRNGTAMNFIGTYNGIVSDIHFEAEGECTTFILLTGTSSSFPCKGISINDCYFNAHNLMNSSITLQYATGVTIRNPTSQLNDYSLIYLYNQAQDLLVEHPSSLDPYLIDGEAATMLTSRLAGTVISGRAVGIIVNAAEEMGYGTVAKLTQNGVAYNVTDVDIMPVAVMFGQQANKPVVVATSGVAQAYCVGAVTWSHVLTGSTTSGQALDYEAAANNTRVILGYALQTTVADGLVWFKVNG